MSSIPYDVYVGKGRQIMIRSWDRGNDEVVTGPYFTLREFWVYEKFAEFLDGSDSSYRDLINNPKEHIELREIIGYHHEEFAKWLVDEQYLFVEQKDILSLHYRTNIKYIEDDSI